MSIANSYRSLCHLVGLPLAIVTSLSACGSAPPPQPPTVTPAPTAPPTAAPAVAKAPKPKAEKVPVLYVAKDESELERKIGKYLTDAGLHVEYREQNDDLMLYLDYTADGGSIEYEVMIDTWFSTNDHSERLVAIRILTGMEIASADRPRILGHINTHHIDYWAGTFYLDSKSKIRGQWTINIPETELPMALITDSITRIASSWLKLRKAIMSSTTGFILNDGSKGVTSKCANSADPLCGL